MVTTEQLHDFARFKTCQSTEQETNETERTRLHLGSKVIPISYKGGIH